MLQDFDFQVRYKSGKTHKDVDALSRNPETADPVLVISRLTEKESAASARSNDRDSLEKVDENEEQEKETNESMKRKEKSALVELEKNEEDKKSKQPNNEKKSTSSASESIPDRQTFLSSQQNDPELMPLIACLLNPSQNHPPAIKKKSRLFLLKSDLLYYSPHSLSSPTRRLCIPRSLIAVILHYLHDDPTAGHLGVQRTFHRARERFYWKKMWKDVHAYVSSCTSCNEIKTSRRLGIGFLQPLAPTSLPFERIGIDTVGPFPRSALGNKYIVTITEYATKTAIAGATKDDTSLSASKVFVHQVILKYGFPKSLISDRGTEFCGQVFSHCLKAFKITHSKTSALHPRSNGQTERFHHCPRTNDGSLREGKSIKLGRVSRLFAFRI